MKLLVSGDREWDDEETVRTVLLKLKPKILVHGDCRGLDRQAGKIAQSLGIEVRKYPANWKLHRKAAGPIRNQEMLDKESPDMLAAFHNNFSNSRGTRDMWNRVGKAHITRRLFISGGDPE